MSKLHLVHWPDTSCCPKEMKFYTVKINCLTFLTMLLTIFPCQRCQRARQQGH